MYSYMHLWNKIRSIHFGSLVFINHMMNASKYFQNVPDFRYVGFTVMTHSTDIPGAATVATYPKQVLTYFTLH